MSEFTAVSSGIAIGLLAMFTGIAKVLRKQRCRLCPRRAAVFTMYEHKGCQVNLCFPCWRRQRRIHREMLRRTRVVHA